MIHDHCMYARAEGKKCAFLFVHVRVCVCMRERGRDCMRANMYVCVCVLMCAHVRVSVYSSMWSRKLSLWVRGGSVDKKPKHPVS